ncbi:MAG: hypothetical protein V2I43_14375 [Parvularcula sp.]|nr:hypothetical protein [Parvularcula sp.]
MTGGIGKEVFEFSVWMSVSKEQSLLIFIEWDYPCEDWLDTHDVMQQACVRVAPLPGSA